MTAADPSPADPPRQERPKKTRRRWLGAARRIARTLAVLLLFGIATVVSVALHSDVAVTRKAAANVGNWLLEDVFFGSLELSAPTRLSLDRLELPSITVYDEQGARIIVLSRVRIELGLWANLTRWFGADEKLTFALPHARIEHSRVVLAMDDTTGEPTIVRALTPKPRPKRAPREARVARDVRVFFPVLELGKVIAEPHETAELKPTLSNVRSQLLITEKGVALDVLRLGANVAGVLGSELRGTGSLKLRAPGQTQARFVGFLGEVEVQAVGTIEGTRVSLEVQSPTTRPEALRKLFGAWPFREPMSATVSARGELPTLETRAELKTETSSVNATGTLTLGSTIAGQWDVIVRGLDAKNFSEHAPETELNAVAHVEVSAGGLLTANVSGRTEALQVYETEVPPMSFNLDYTGGEVEGQLTLHEPGAEVETTISVDREGTLDAGVHVPRFALQKSRRIPRGPRGLATLDGRVHLEGSQLEVSARGSVRGFSLGELGAARLDFRVRGSSDVSRVEDGSFELETDAQGVRYGVIRYASLTGTARGTRHRIHAQARLSDPDGRSLKAKGQILSNGTFERIELEAVRHGVEVSALVDRLDPRIPELVVRRVAIRSEGAKLDGKFHYRPGLLEGELHADGVDLARVASAFGLPSGYVQGRVTSSSEFTLGRDVSRASLDLDIENAAVRGWGRAQLQIDSTLRERVLSGSISGRDDTTGILLGSTFDLQLAGFALELDSWRDATGTAELSISNVRLAGIDWLVLPEDLSEVDGLVGLRARFERDRAARWPSMMLEVGAQNVQAHVRVSEDVRIVEHLSAHVSGVFDARQNKVYGAGTLGHGASRLLSLSAALDFDPDAWVMNPEAALTAFRDQPINVVVNVPPRRLDQLPLVQPQDVPAGSVAGQLTLFGSLREPQLSALIDLTDIAPRDGETRPVSFKLSGLYAPTTGDVDATVVGHADSRSVAMGRIDGKVPWTALMGVARWDAEARVAFDRFPLDLIPELQALELGGNVTGTMRLSQGQTATLDAQLDVTDLTASRSVLGSGTLGVIGGPGEAQANFSLSDSGRSLNLRVLALGRDDEQLPLPHQLRSVGISLTAKRLNASALTPLLRDAVARLHGDMDADLTWFLERVEREGQATWEGRLEGAASLREGGAYIDALGIELHDIEAELTARPAGTRTLIQLGQLRAKARTTEVNFEGSGQVYLEGTHLVAGDAQVLLRSVPITLQGLSLGRASGQAECVFERVENWDVPGPHEGKDYLAINVRLEHWQMKAARSASRRLIDLRSNPEIVILQEHTDDAARPDLTPYRVFIALGRDVRFGFGDMSLPLDGEARVDYDGTSRVTGTLRIHRGTRLPIFGKRFDVLSGVIELDPKDLGNPGLDLALTGTTPEGNAVNLTVSGTLREPILQPPPSELQALLGGGTATLLGGGVQALGVNELLGESVGNVELRVDAGEEEDADPSYAAAVQIGPDLWFEGGYQRAQDSGINQSASDVFSGSVDYRFHPNWSLKTRLGNAGGGVDVLWQHRY